jgi:hypothetical protein
MDWHFLGPFLFAVDEAQGMVQHDGAPHASLLAVSIDANPAVWLFPCMGKRRL